MDNISSLFLIYFRLTSVKKCRFRVSQDKRISLIKAWKEERGNVTWTKLQLYNYTLFIIWTNDTYDSNNDPIFAAIVSKTKFSIVIGHPTRSSDLKLLGQLLPELYSAQSNNYYL